MGTQSGAPTSVGRRTASPQFTLSGVTNCACCASCSGIRRVRLSSRLSAGGRETYYIVPREPVGQKAFAVIRDAPITAF
jgi:hypothetical protein